MHKHSPEQQQWERSVAQLLNEFHDQVAPVVIERCAQDALAAFRDSRVQQYVPLLAYRSARERVRMLSTQALLPARGACLRVAVRLAWRRPRPGERAEGLPAPPELGPVIGIRVQVVTPTVTEDPAPLLRPSAPANVVAEQVTDAQGRAEFALPPGRYWVQVPWSDDVPGYPGTVPMGTTLPDERRVLAWQELVLAHSTTVDVGLTVSRSW